MTVSNGHCLCGATTVTLTGPHNWVGHCHCDSCRRATASAFATWIGHPNDAWSFTGQDPKTFVSSPGRLRGFCGTCGTPMFYKSDAYPDETHFYAALMDNAADLTPTDEFFPEDKLPWAHLPKDLATKELKT